MKKIFLILIIASFLFPTISCNEQNKGRTVNYKTDAQIEIKNPWMTPAAKNRNSAVYFTITNNSNITDTLYEAVSELSQITELHETYEIREDMLGMKTIQHVIVPANSTFYFSPGGFHVMLIGLIDNLPVGAPGKITLKFKTAGNITIHTDCRVSQK